MKPALPRRAASTRLPGWKRPHGGRRPSLRTLPDARSTVPIIAMTANAFEEDKQRAFDAGMNDHISKPISVNALLAALRKNLK